MNTTFATRIKKIIFTSLFCANIGYDIDTITINRSNLDRHIQDITQQYLLDNDIQPHYIPYNFQTEFEAKVHTIQAELLTMLSQRYSGYINRYDVERVVRSTMRPFVNKVRDARASQQFTTFITSNLWDFFTRPNRPVVAPAPVYHVPAPVYQAPAPVYQTTYAAPQPQANANQIQASELEQRVMTLAYKVIECTPDTVPARVVSDFSDKIQKSLKRLRDTMRSNGRSYVWQDEVETTLLKELQSVVDAIHYKTEACSICLDNYTRGQRIAHTSCGHVYHKDCIYRWLETSGNKSCPLCRAQNVIVAKQETVS